MNARALLFAALTLTAVWLAAYTWLLHGRLHDLHTAQNEEERLKTQWRLQAAVLRTPEQLRREQAALQLSAAQLRRALPEEASIPDFIDALNHAAARRNLTLSAIAPLAAEARGSLNAHPFRIAAEGSYPELRAFIGDIAELPRTTTLSRLQLRLNNSGSVSFEARATVYTAAADGITQEGKP